MESWETLDIVMYGGLAVTAYLVVKKIFGAMHRASPVPPTPKRKPIEKRDFTREELKEFDGSNPEKPILVGIKGKVFDVSRSAGFYGPGGSYGVFAGKDASRALAKSSTEDAVANNPSIDDLPKDELDTLDEWYQHFLFKYEVIGNIIESREQPTPQPAAVQQ